MGVFRPKGADKPAIPAIKPTGPTYAESLKTIAKALEDLMSANGGVVSSFQNLHDALKVSPLPKDTKGWLEQRLEDDIVKSVTGAGKGTSTTAATGKDAHLIVVDEVATISKGMWGAMKASEWGAAAVKDATHTHKHTHTDVTPKTLPWPEAIVRDKDGVRFGSYKGGPPSPSRWVTFPVDDGREPVPGESYTTTGVVGPRLPLTDPWTAHEVDAGGGSISTHALKEVWMDGKRIYAASNVDRPDTDTPSAGAAAADEVGSW